MSGRQRHLDVLGQAQCPLMRRQFKKLSFA